MSRRGNNDGFVRTVGFETAHGDHGLARLLGRARDRPCNGTRCLAVLLCALDVRPLARNPLGDFRWNDDLGGGVQPGGAGARPRQHVANGCRDAGRGRLLFHNIPEGIAVSIPLRATGLSPWLCVGYAILTSVPQPLAAVPAYLLVDFFQPLLPAGLGFAGGAMIFLVAAELLPESLENCSREDAAWGFTIGLTVMLLITSSLGLLAATPAGSP